MQFKIEKNQISRLDDELLTTENVNSVECSFSFSDDYDGLELYAVFYRDSSANCFVPLSDGNCILPHELLEDEGFLYVGAYGIKNTTDTVEKRITTNSVAIRILKCLSSSTSPAAAPTPDIWEKYSATILGYKTSAETAANTATVKANVSESSANIAQTAAETATQKANSASISAQNADSSKIEADDILSRIIQYAGGAGGSNVISSATQTNLNGLLKGDGEYISTATAGTDYATPAQVNEKQNTITANGILKGNGNGSISSAITNTDYQSPITTSGVLKGNGNGIISAASAGVDYVSPTGSYINPVSINGANLNDCITPGYYATVGSVDASTYNPFGTMGFLLEVIKRNDTIMQRATAYNGYYIAVRYMSTASSSWTTWNYQQQRIMATGILKGAGAGGVTAATAGTDYQAAITASGILKGNGSGTISAAVAGTDYATPTTNLLWSGVKLMNPNTDQNITLSQPVSKQNKGIVLVFSEFNNSTNTAGNSLVSSHFVSKYEVSAMSGVGHLFTTFATWGKAMAKYLYITDTTISGHDANDNTGTATCGILYDNTCYVLRYVIGV